MAINITNLTANPLSLSIGTGRRQIQRTFAPGVAVDVSSVATLDELNGSTTIAALLNATPPKISLTESGTPLAALPTEEDIRQRTGFPEVHALVGAAVSAGTPTAESVIGANLLAGKAQASATFGSGTSSVLVEACRPGTPGNLIRVILQTGAGELVAVSGGAVAGESTVARTITVTSNNGVSTGNSIATLINAHATAKLLVRATGGGTGTALGYATKNLSGGTGAGFKCFIGSIEQNVTAKVSNTALPMQTVALAPLVAGDNATLSVMSDNTKSFPLTVDVLA